MYYKTEGVILGKNNFGEADRILTIYTKDFGKLTCLAKGVRRPKSRKGGHIELGNWCRIYIAKGKNLDLLTEVEIKKAFGSENFSEEKANQIYHILEIVKNLTAEKQKNIQIFVLLIQFLKKISMEEDFDLISSAFKIKLLSTLGFFSPKSLQESKTKNLLKIIETEDVNVIKEKILLSKVEYLKLLTFLDSIIEKLIEGKLNTKRFLT